MAKRQQIGYLPPQLRKLQRSQNLTTNEVIKELKKAQRTIAKEVAYLTGQGGCDGQCQAAGENL